MELYKKWKLSILLLFLVLLLDFSSGFVNTPKNLSEWKESRNDETASGELFNKRKKLRKCCQEGYVVRNDPGVGLTCVEMFPPQSNASLFRRIHSILDSYGVEEVNKISFSGTNKSNEIPSYCAATEGNNKPRILNNREGIWFKISSTFPQSISVGLDYFIWAAWIKIDQKEFYCLDIDDVTFTNCFNNTTNRNEDVTTSSKRSLDCKDDLVLIFCNLEYYKHTEFIAHRYLYGVSSLFTCVPILATLFLFFHLKIHNNPRKWIFISYFASYCFACATHGVQIIMYLDNLEQEATIMCRLYNHLFLYFCCVFGTACMFVSLDIFNCFWKMNSRLGIINPSRNGIIISLLISWLGPLVIYVGGEVLREYFAKSPPDLGWKKCMSLNLDIVELLIMIQFVFKFGVYLSTSILIYKHKKSTSFATPGAKNDFNESKTLYAKLFVTTGMPFTCLALDYCFAYEDPMAWYWFILRFPHSFIGIYIFLVFGLSKEVRTKWKEVHTSFQETELKHSNSSETSTSSGNSKR